MTFSEDFDDVLSVSPWGPNTRWIAHTPWAGDFGDARFADPQLGVFPFTIENGILRIEARKDADGKWASGLLASTDPNGRGFSQQYGCFEIRAKLPRRLLATCHQSYRPAEPSPPTRRVSHYSSSARRKIYLRDAEFHRGTGARCASRKTAPLSFFLVLPLSREGLHSPTSR
jgi:hypothetical protein